MRSVLSAKQPLTPADWPVLRKETSAKVMVQPLAGSGRCVILAQDHLLAFRSRAAQVRRLIIELGQLWGTHLTSRSHPIWSITRLTTMSDHNNAVWLWPTLTNWEEAHPQASDALR
jgi:hypothetical protein